eukprot:2349214-Amphidinium_carterae.2
METCCAMRLLVARLGTARMALVRVSLGAWPAFVIDTWDRAHGAGSCLFGRMAHVCFRAWRPDVKKLIGSLIGSG